MIDFEEIEWLHGLKILILALMLAYAIFLALYLVFGDSEQHLTAPENEMTCSAERVVVDENRNEVSRTCIKWRTRPNP